MRLFHSWRWIAVIGACVLLVGAAKLAAMYFEGLAEMVALVGVGVVASGLAFWALPRWQAEEARDQGSDKEPFELENEARKTLAQALGGLFLVIGLAATWQQLVATEHTQQSARNEQLYAQGVQQTASALEESGQITERYANAVDQLASEDEVVVHGAIHSLSRIGEDSERDREAVIRVLARWIQDVRPIPEVSAAPPGTPGADALAPTSAVGPPPSLEDAVRALWVISHLQSGSDQATPPATPTPKKVIVPCVDLGRVSLPGASLTGFDLRGMCLTESDLTEATLTGAKLSQTTLTGAILTNATLFEADLSLAILTSTKLGGAKLAGANFSNANLSGADLRGADLSNVLAGTLIQDQIDKAQTDSGTQLPDGLVLPAIPTRVGVPPAAPGPTLTPKPTPATDDFAVSDTVVVNADGANLRAAPTVTASILRQLSPGSRLMVIGPAQEADGAVWWPVEFSAEVASGAVQGQGSGLTSGWVIGDALVLSIRAPLASAVWGGTPAQVTVEFGEDVKAWDPGCNFYAYAKALGLNGCQYPAISIALPRGTPLFAAEGGTVEFAGFDVFYRPYHVNIRTADGQLHTYAHMWSVNSNVVVGGQVAAGQFLGESGEPTISGTMEPSGQGPFLFFEVRDKDGLLIDPEPILQDAPIEGGTTATHRDDTPRRLWAGSGTATAPLDNALVAPPRFSLLRTYARRRQTQCGRLRWARGIPPSR